MTTANPLDQLKDIHLPEAVGFWPPALGWWLLAAVFVVILLTGILLYKRHQKNAYRRSAVRQLNSLLNDYPQPLQSQQIAAQLNQLLKAVAQQSYSTKQVSRLTESQWLNFLDSSANMQSFAQGPGQILASVPYDKNRAISDPSALKQCCAQWIRRHQ